MGEQDFEGREHSAIDMLVLAIAVVLSLVTWSYLDVGNGVPAWKPYVSIALTFLLALAALTRHSRYAKSLRLLNAGWMIAAPFLLQFLDVVPACCAHLASGTLLIAVSVLATRRDMTELPETISESDIPRQATVMQGAGV